VLCKLKTVFIFFLVFVAFLFGLYYYLQKKEKERLELARIEQKKKELEELRKKEKEAARLNAERERQKQLIREEHRKQRQELISKASSGSVAQPTFIIQTTTPVPTSTSTKHRGIVEAACKKARCTLVSYSEQGDSSTIVVEGPDHVSVSEILDYLIPEGMRDFTDHKEFKASMKDGRRVYTASYTIKW